MKAMSFRRLKDNVNGNRRWSLKPNFHLKYVPDVYFYWEEGRPMKSLLDIMRILNLNQ